eukprot:547573_1
MQSYLSLFPLLWLTIWVSESCEPRGTIYCEIDSCCSGLYCSGGYVCASCLGSGASCGDEIRNDPCCSGSCKENDDGLYTCPSGGVNVTVNITLVLFSIGGVCSFALICYCIKNNNNNGGGNHYRELDAFAVCGEN